MNQPNTATPLNLTSDHNYSVEPNTRILRTATAEKIAALLPRFCMTCQYRCRNFYNGQIFLKLNDLSYWGLVSILDGVHGLFQKKHK